MRSEAEQRHERLLWEPVSYPTPVLILIDAEHPAHIESAIAEQQARRDDAFWARFVKRFPVTPQGFLNWWVARRWVRPRDITKE